MDNNNQMPADLAPAGQIPNNTSQPSSNSGTGATGMPADLTPAGATPSTASNSGHHFDIGGNGPGMNLKGVVNTVGQGLSGVGEGIFSTVAGAADMANKIPGVHIPTDTLHELAGDNETKTGVEKIGYGGETLMEFLLGDEALKGLSFADKLDAAAKTAKVLQKSPKLMKAAQIGAKVLDQSVRAGAVQTAQSTVRSGGDIKEGLKEGANVGAIAAPLGVVGEGLAAAGGKLTKGAEAAKGLTDAANSAPNDTAGTADMVQDAVEKSKQALHQNYENGINDLVTRAGNTEIDPVHDVGLNGKPAMANRAGNLIQQPIPSDSFLVNKAKAAIGEKLDTPVKDILRTVETGYKDPEAFDKWAQQQADIKSGKLADINGKLFDSNKYNKYIQNIQLGAKADEPQEIAKLVEPEKIEPYNMDNLIKLRQTLRQLASNYDYGNINSRTILSKGGMLHAIDDTIDQLAQKVPDRNILQDYRDLRADYKSKIGIYDTPVIKNIQAGKYDDAAKALMSGNKGAGRVQDLRTILGDAKTDEFAHSVFGNMLQDSVDTNGQVNAAKLVKSWDKIPDETKESLFQPKLGGQDITKLMSDARVAKSIQLLTRAGVISPAAAIGGQLTHLGLIGMLLFEGAGAGTTAIGRVADALDYIANHPTMWKSIGVTGKVLQKVAPKVAPTGAGLAGQALSDTVKRSVYNAATGLQQ